MPNPGHGAKQSRWNQNDSENFNKGSEHICPPDLNIKAVKLTLLSMAALLTLGALLFFTGSGDAQELKGPGLCQPCDAASLCGVLVQDVVSPSDSLSALVFGSVRTAYLPLECKANVCVPAFLPQPESVCKPVVPFAPSEIQAFQGRRDNTFSSRKLLMERQATRSLRKRRRLQRIRNDKFTEYFNSRAMGSGSDGGHGYLGIHSHTRED